MNYKQRKEHKVIKCCQKFFSNLSKRDVSYKEAKRINKVLKQYEDD
ncbi:hypothetical protein [Clostridium sp.]|nr:hypothetical protein [Clostridium sp.]MDU2106339.1 hypothetical protein [Clostridium sp.]MDU3352787.1 hypothetical protein [Clostridium sp.]